MKLYGKSVIVSYRAKLVQKKQSGLAGLYPNMFISCAKRPFRPIPEEMAGDIVRAAKNHPAFDVCECSPIRYTIHSIFRFECPGHSFEIRALDRSEAIRLIRNALHISDEDLSFARALNEMGIKRWALQKTEVTAYFPINEEQAKLNQNQLRKLYVSYC